MTPPAFIARMLSGALACQRRAGIPASFTIAQAALESGWAKRVRGNNLFGIKADRAWKGATVDIVTHEVIQGRRVALVASFRAYASWEQCIVDREDFLLSNPRYARCFAEKTGEGWARAIAAAGYATDPRYAQQLIAVMRGRGLQQYDTVCP